MKYASLFPEVRPGTEPHKGLTRVDCLVDCFCCGDQTQFVDVLLRGGTCSQECAKRLALAREKETWPDYSSALVGLESQDRAA